MASAGGGGAADGGKGEEGREEEGVLEEGRLRRVVMVEGREEGRRRREMGRAKGRRAPSLCCLKLF